MRRRGWIPAAGSLRLRDTCGWIPAAGSLWLDPRGRIPAVGSLRLDPYGWIPAAGSLDPARLRGVGRLEHGRAFHLRGGGGRYAGTQSDVWDVVLHVVGSPARGAACGAIPSSAECTTHQSLPETKVGQRRVREVSTRSARDQREISARSERRTAMQLGR